MGRRFVKSNNGGGATSDKRGACFKDGDPAGGRNREELGMRKKM